MITEVIFDVETKRLFADVGGFDATKLGVSILSMYMRQVSEQQEELSGKLMSFWEDELDAVWQLFTKAHRVIGFNSINFDIQVLKPFAPIKLDKLPHFDILNVIRGLLGHNLSLNTLAKATLGKEKTDVGTQVVSYWQSGDPEKLKKLKAYCEADVLLTKDVYDYAVRNKTLHYVDKWNVSRSVAVDFSYPKSTVDNARQIGLF